MVERKTGLHRNVEFAATGTQQFGPCTPSFIVADLSRSLDHHVGKLGFERRHAAPDETPFFAIVGCGAAQIMLKAFGEQVPVLPNRDVHEWARWDAFVHTADPDAIAVELAARGVSFHTPLANTDDGLCGFGIADPDGYVCFFGRPLDRP